MTDVLVCIKRVPDTSGQVLLTEDAQSVDARFVGFTLSNHEQAAIELAIQGVEATGGSVTLVTVGSADAAEQLRSGLALGCQAAVLVEADPATLGPADVAAELAAVAAEGSYDLVLLGNDAADSGDFQVPVRLAYALDRPIVVGATTVTVDGGTVTARVDGPEGYETYEMPAPAVASVLEGGVEPRYPSLKGRMAAKKIEIQTRPATREAVGASRVRLTLPPAEANEVEILGEGAPTAPKVVDLFERLAVL